ncbi:MAG: outer membrane protein [Phreatobacter sp.]
MALAAVAALTSGAKAADLGTARGPVLATAVSQAFGWSGFYLGAHAGFGWAKSSYQDFTGSAIFTSADVTANGLFGGVQAGYNWQVNNFVLGVEGDLSLGGLRQRTVLAAPAGDIYRARVPFLSSLRLRAGYAIDRALLYVTGGLGVATFTERYTDNVAIPAVTYRASSTRAGYTVGGGLEYALDQNWTTKVEYLYYGFGDVRNAFTTNDRVRTNIHTVKLGLNYLFSTGPSAVIARY